MDPADPGRDALLIEQARSLTWAGRPAQAETVCRALLARDHDSSVTAGARIYLARTLMARGRARDALRELEAAAGSAAPGSEELVSARTLESFARLSVGDLDGACSAAAEALSADSSAWGRKDASAAMTSLTVAAQLPYMAMTSLALAAQLRGELSSALQITDDAADLADRSPGGMDHRYRPLWTAG